MADFSWRSGQAMIIATLTLGGAMLGATVLAGLLTLYNVRATTNSENSAKAVFAADAGINWVLYAHFDASSSPPASPTFLDNRTTVAITCREVDGATSIACTNASATQATAKGSANDSSRAFLLNILGATSTLP